MLDAFARCPASRRPACQLTPLGNSTWNEEIIIDGFTPKSEDDGVAFFNEVSAAISRQWERHCWLGVTSTATTASAPHRDHQRNDGAAILWRVESGWQNFPLPRWEGVSNPLQVVAVVKDASISPPRENAGHGVRSSLAERGARLRHLSRGADSHRGRRGIPSVKSALEGVDATFKPVSCRSRRKLPTR
jgi:hypothetical protein